MIQIFIKFVAIIISLFHFNVNQNLRQDIVARSLPVKTQFISISDIIRVSHTSIDYLNGLIITGDELGAISLWTYENHRLYFHSVTRNNETKQIDKVTNVKIFNEGRTCAFVTESGKFMIYDVSNVSFPKKTFDKKLNITKFVITKDSNKLISIFGNQLQIWQFINNEINLIFTNPVTEIIYLNIHISADDKFIATGNQDKLNLFRLYSNQLTLIQSATQLKTYTNLFSVKFSSNQSHLITTNAQWIFHWEYNQSILNLRNFSRIGYNSFLLDITPSGKFICTNNNNFIKFYQIKDYQIINLIQIQKMLINDIKYTEQNYLITAGEKLIIFQLDYTKNSTELIKEEVQYYIDSKNHINPVYSIQVNNKLIITTSQGYQNIKLWQINQSQLNLLQSDTIQSPTTKKIMNLSSSSLSLDNQLFAAGGSEPFDIIVYTIDNMRLGNRFRSDISFAHKSKIIGLEITCDSKHIVSVSSEGSIYVWEILNKKQIVWKFKSLYAKQGFTNMILSKDSKFLITSDILSAPLYVANLTIWSIDYDKNQINFVNQTFFQEAHQSDVAQLIISPDQKYLIGLGTNGEIKFWRLQNYTMIDLMQEISLGIYGSVAFTSTGQFIMATTQTSIDLYRYDQNGLILESKNRKNFYLSTPTMIKEDESAKYFIEGNNDQSLRLYDLIR